MLSLIRDVCEGSGMHFAPFGLAAGLGLLYYLEAIPRARKDIFEVGFITERRRGSNRQGLMILGPSIENTHLRRVLG